MPRLVVVHPDRRAQRALQRVVGATSCEIDVVVDAEACASAIDADSIVVIDAAFALAHPELRARGGLAWIAVPSDESTAADASTMQSLLEAGWLHTLAHPMPILAEELLATVQKLARVDIFGLEKYMVWGAETRSYTLHDAREREAAVARLANDVIGVGLPDRVSSLVSVIADELIANAVYAAPVDDTGARYRLREPRDAGRPLAGRDAVPVRWATDARYLAIEVADSWGSLGAGSIGPRIAAAGRQLATSADDGMGLSLAYACCNQFIVNHTPGTRTEVITLLDVRYKPTELGRSASFHEFVTP